MHPSPCASFRHSPSPRNKSPRCTHIRSIAQLSCTRGCPEEKVLYSRGRQRPGLWNSPSARLAISRGRPAMHYLLMTRRHRHYRRQRRRGRMMEMAEGERPVLYTRGPRREDTAERAGISGARLTHKSTLLTRREREREREEEPMQRRSAPLENRCFPGARRDSLVRESGFCARLGIAAAP